MKIRTGFISNSSTTSFCIMGIYEQHMDRKDASEFCGESLLVNYGYYGMDGQYIGVPIKTMKEDETLNQFRNRVKKIFLDKEVVCIPDLIVEGWYDG